MEPRQPIRPPPLPISLTPRRAPPPPRAEHDSRAPPISEGTPWHPLPEPALAREAPLKIDTSLGGLLEPERDAMLNHRLAWIALMGLAFAFIVILLVIAPTEAVPKLVGPFAQPVSGSGYGPMVAMFGFLAFIVVLIGGVWMWIAMGRPYEPPPEDQPTAAPPI